MMASIVGAVLAAVLLTVGGAFIVKTRCMRSRVHWTRTRLYAPKVGRQPVAPLSSAISPGVFIGDVQLSKPRVAELGHSVQQLPVMTAKRKNVVKGVVKRTVKCSTSSVSAADSAPPLLAVDEAAQVQHYEPLMI